MSDSFLGPLIYSRGCAKEIMKRVFTLQQGKIPEKLTAQHEYIFKILYSIQTLQQQRLRCDCNLNKRHGEIDIYLKNMT